MRLIIVLTLVLLSSSNARADDVESIKPGMPLKEVKAALIRHGYGVGPEHGGAIVSGNKDIEIEFCTIDARTMLIISYRELDERVVSLDVYFYPDKLLPKTEQQDVRRKARKIFFDEGDTFTVSLERVEKKSAKQPGAVNPFE